MDNNVVKLTFPGEGKLRYSEGAPAAIVSQELYKRTDSENVFAVLGIKSLSDKKIVAVKVAFATSDIEGNPLDGENEYTFLDLSLSYGDTVGTDKRIFFSDNTARHYAAKITLVIFEDMSKWSLAADAAFVDLPERKKIEEGLKDAAEVAAYKQFTSDRSRFVPEKIGTAWFCACGTLNHVEKDKCPLCGCSSESVFSLLDSKQLSRRLEEKEAEDAKEKLKQAAAFAKKKESTKKDMFITLIVCAAVLLVSVLSSVIASALRFHDLLDRLESDCKYSEFYMVDFVYTHKAYRSIASKPLCNAFRVEYCKIDTIENDETAPHDWNPGYCVVLEDSMTIRVYSDGTFSVDHVDIPGDTSSYYSDYGSYYY